jgi:hypothetical protein
MTRIISIVGGLQPSAPTIGTATAVDATSATVGFTASSYIGKGTITYTATSSPGGLTGTSATSPITVSGLTTGTAYTFTVVGNTNYGVPSLASAASNSITPAALASFESIQTITGNTSQTVTFNTIPQTFTHLQLRISARASLGSYTFTGYSMRVGNGSVDTGNNYSNHRMYTSGNDTETNDGGINESALNGPWVTANNAISNNFAVTLIDILDYKNTSKYKTTKIIQAFDNNASGDSGFTANAVAGISFGGGNWRSFSAIDTISFGLGGSATTNTNSVFALYGIKGA